MIAFAPSPARPDALLTPVAPGHAYAADVARLNGREPVGPADDAWLAVAHAIARAAALPAAQRPAVLAAGADALRALLPEGLAPAARRTLLAAADGLHTVAAHLGRRGAADRPPAPSAADAGTVHDALAAMQRLVADEEQAGAFLLAFSTLAAARQAFAPVLDARGEGLLLAQQGRVARQLGALTTAAELYDSAVRLARAARAPDVAARALIGTGSLATMRGNYPEARTLYRRALRTAERIGDTELSRAAHHGLLAAAFAAHDVDTALAHGWAAVRALSENAADERAEMLLNLGEVGRQAGEYRAALGACLSVLELTDLARLRLPAVGSAALAAARLGETRLLDFLAREADRLTARSGQPYENARAFVELAEAYVNLDAAQALQYARRATELADAGGFHEVAARADRVSAAANAQDLAVSARIPEDCAAQSWALTVRSPRARAALRSLEMLPNARRYAAAIA